MGYLRGHDLPVGAICECGWIVIVRTVQQVHANADEMFNIAANHVNGC